MGCWCGCCQDDEIHTGRKERRQDIVVTWFLLGARRRIRWLFCLMVCLCCGNRCDTHALLVLFVYHGLLSFIKFIMDLITRCIMVFDLNYSVSSCSICVVHLFFSCVVVISSYRTHGSCVTSSDHQLQHVTTWFPLLRFCWSPCSSTWPHPTLRKSFFMAWMDQWNMCQHCLDFQTLWPFLVHFVTSRSQKCQNIMQLICMYKALISFSVISTNSMFLDGFCI